MESTHGMSLETRSDQSGSPDTSRNNDGTGGDIIFFFFLFSIFLKFENNQPFL